MTDIKLGPLHRFAIGFDHMDQLLQNLTCCDENASYPPYNVEKHGENEYRITMAVAGFGAEDLDLTVQGETLIISGRKSEGDRHPDCEYLHKGIAMRSFERKFELAGHIKIKSAQLDRGLLCIDLKREIPEEMKPRKIAISETIQSKKIITDQTKK